ncbi:MAG: hypothetical protein HYV28_07905, partial [Ignavibacteriales bacterium]|nr:hypothetical protein [Ignavibacteriales bacterium]
MKILAMFQLIIALVLPSIAFAQQSDVIMYNGKTPDGLVGNGKSVVKVRPSGFEFHTGGDAAGVFRLIIDGKAYEVSSPDAR